MKANDCIDINIDVPAFNEWTDNDDDIIICDINRQDNIIVNVEASDDDDSDHTMQLYQIISELESKLLDN